MPFQNINQIRKKDEMEKIAKELEKIVELPELKKLVSEAVLIEHTIPHTVTFVLRTVHADGRREVGDKEHKIHDIYRLILSPKGLEEYSWVAKKHVVFAGDHSWFDEKRVNLNKNDYPRIIETYNITMQDVKQLRSKLEN